MDDAADKLPSSDQNQIASEYANNVSFDASVWDLKLLFGEYSERAKGIEWHTSITIPWALVRLLQYYLQINLEMYELRHGKAMLPDTMIPADPVPPPDNDPTNRAMFEIIQRNRMRLLDSLKATE